jgi:hypothetical protein
MFRQTHRQHRTNEANGGSMDAQEKPQQNKDTLELYCGQGTR